MIVNGIDIIGYEWCKLVKSNEVKYEVEGTDIILYGSRSSQFSDLFEIVEDLEINDTEYIDLTTRPIHRIGSLSIQSNTIDPVLLDILVTNDQPTTSVCCGNHIIIVCNSSDVYTIDLAKISDEVRLLNIGKLQDKCIGNVRNLRITQNNVINCDYYSSKVFPFKSIFMTNMNYGKCLNTLNMKLKEILPDFELVVGKRDKINSHQNTIYCEYSSFERNMHHMFKQFRRNISFRLPVTYRFLITDDTKFLRYYYEFENYDLVTNICQLSTKDQDNGLEWTFSIHWEVEPIELDLQEVKVSEGVGREIKCTANIDFITDIDSYLIDLRKSYDAIIERIQADWNEPLERSVVTKDDVIYSETNR